MLTRFLRVLVSIRPLTVLVIPEEDYYANTGAEEVLEEDEEDEEEGEPSQATTQPARSCLRGADYVPKGRAKFDPSVDDAASKPPQDYATLQLLLDDGYEKNPKKLAEAKAALQQDVKVEKRQTKRRLWFQRTVPEPKELGLRSLKKENLKRRRETKKQKKAEAKEAEQQAARRRKQWWWKVTTGEKEEE